MTQTPKTAVRHTNWNIVDRFLSYWRTRFIYKYINENCVIADVGCGRDGIFLKSIANKIKEGHGFDFNLKGRGVYSNVTLHNTDFLDDHKTYDVILLMAVLEHIPYPHEVEAVIRKIHRSLNEGGYFIMTTPDRRAKGILEFLAYKLHLINEEEIRDHKHYFTKKELVALMRQAGFRNIEHRYFQCGLNNLLICQL